MLSPSTAPRWKRHTKTGRLRAAWGGKGSYELKAARARNSGSRPKLNKARPPDFTKTRLEMVIVSETPVHRARGRRRGHAPEWDRRSPPAHVPEPALYSRTLSHPGSSR